jgi:hypothetical protein
VHIGVRKSLVDLFEAGGVVGREVESGVAAHVHRAVGERPAHGIGVAEGLDLCPGDAAVGRHRHGLVAANEDPVRVCGIDDQGVEVATGESACALFVAAVTTLPDDQRDPSDETQCDENERGVSDR